VAEQLMEDSNVKEYDVFFSLTVGRRISTREFQGYLG
jgi:hypothetical protein